MRAQREGTLVARLGRVRSGRVVDPKKKPSFGGEQSKRAAFIRSSNNSLRCCRNAARGCLFRGCLFRTSHPAAMQRPCAERRWACAGGAPRQGVQLSLRAARWRWHSAPSQQQQAVDAAESYDWQQYRTNSSQRQQRADWASSVRWVRQLCANPLLCCTQWRSAADHNRRGRLEACATQSCSARCTSSSAGRDGGSEPSRISMVPLPAGTQTRGSAQLVAGAHIINTTS